MRRPPGRAPEAVDVLSPRWRGQAGRLEVYYLTASDPEARTGIWVHHELVAPSDGAAPYVHGWASWFEPDCPPVLERFGPRTLRADEHESLAAGRAELASLFSCDDAAIGASEAVGAAGRLRWQVGLEASDAPRPLCTFPAWAWQREALPGAQALPVPSAPARGSVHVDGQQRVLGALARGGLAHIFGHGSPERWGWLHAELGSGDVLEVVAATARSPGLSKLPPFAFVQLRIGDEDWPRDPLIAAPRFRVSLGLPTWRVRGTVGRWRLDVEVVMPEDRRVEVGYVDPDGSTATCTNSEVADAVVELWRKGRAMERIARFELEGSAHAEVGTRP